MKGISWLIPTYNEEQTIRQVIEQIPIGKPYVFDKSSDNTAKIAREAGAIVMHRNGLGKGDAIREAIEFLSPISDIIVTIDGDATYLPAEVFPLIEEVNNGADMVVGSRFLGAMEKDAMSKRNYIGNMIINFIINLLFRSRVTDSVSGFRAIRVSSLKEIGIDSSGFEIEAELTTKFLKNGFKVIEKPITYRSRPRFSKSKLNVVRDMYRNLRMILKIRLA